MYMPAKPAPTIMASKTVPSSAGWCCFCWLSAMAAFVLMETQSVRLHQPKACEPSITPRHGRVAPYGRLPVPQARCSGQRARPQVSLRLEELDDRQPLLGQKCPFADLAHGTFGLVVEFVPLVRVAANGGLEQEAVGEWVGPVAELLGIVLTVTEIEFARSVLCGREQVVDGRHRTIVEIGRRRPDAVERADLVGKLAPDLVRHISVESIPLFLVQGRVLAVVDVIDGLFDHGLERFGESVLVDAEIGRQR